MRVDRNIAERHPLVCLAAIAALAVPFVTYELETFRKETRILAMRRICDVAASSTQHASKRQQRHMNNDSKEMGTRDGALLLAEVQCLGVITAVARVIAAVKQPR